MRGRGFRSFARFGLDSAPPAPSDGLELRVTQLFLEVAFSTDTPVVEPIEPPDGDGEPEPGINPPADDSICGAEVPVTWCDIVFPDGLTRRYSQGPINVGDPKEPRALMFGTVRRSLSNAQGEPVGSTMTPTLSDYDGALRTFEDADSLIGSRYTQYVSSKALLQADPTNKTRVFDGVITDAEPLAQRVFSVQVTDYLTVLLDEFNKRTFPARVFNLEDFPSMGNDSSDPVDPGNPTMVGKPVPRLYGELSDEFADVPIGVVPFTFTGRVPFASRGGQLWDEYIISSHALGAWQSGFVASGGGLSTGTPYPSRVQINAGSGLVEVAWPGNPWWIDEFGSDTTITRNGREYGAMYMFGPRSDLSRLGQVPHVWNVWGVADADGKVITDLYLQFLDVLTNVVFGNYETGASLGIPTVGVGPDLYSRIDTDTIFGVKALRDSQFPATTFRSAGVPGAFILGHSGQALTFAELLKLFARNGHFEYGVNRHGQLGIYAIDDGKAINRDLTALANVLRQTYRAKRARDLIRNVVNIQAARRYVPPLSGGTPAEGDLLPKSTTQINTEWVSTPEPLRDEPSITKYGERPEDIDFELIRDEDVAINVAGLTLDENAVGPVIVSFEEAECGVDTDLGMVDSLVHFDALSEGKRGLRCQVHELNLDTFAVAKTYRERPHGSPS